MKTQIWFAMVLGTWLVPVASAAEGGAMAAATQPASPMITVQTLLDEMVSYDAVARWPQPAYTCGQFSSYDRATKTPDDPKGWFANHDHTQYIRVETVGGRTENVMMDADGPGAIVRFWITSNAKKKGNLRIYLDGAETPTVTISSFDFANNDALPAGNPLLTLHPGAAPQGRGGNTLYLPIPYAKHCKVTWEEGEAKAPRYYQINYRTYPAGTKVETFKPGGNYENVDRLLASPPVFKGSHEASLGPTTITPRAAVSWGSNMGPAAIRWLELSADPAALRQLVLLAEFDGEQTIWCPVGDFFGSGLDGRVLESWYRTTAKEGVMSCRWVMPYEKNCFFRLLNVGKTPVKAKLTVRDDKWNWDDRSMHFHATWRQQYPIATRPMSDWNYLSATGQGVYVGDSLVVYNPSKAWWGEGDEKIYIDDEKFPSHIGTGSEDYYNYSWGDTHLFQTPFANQVRCDGPGNRGYSIVTRTRSLDAIPFTKSLRFDMEVWHWADCKVAYAATAYWYARPGATSNRLPQPEEAARELPASEAAGYRIPGALECEQMKIVAKAEGVPAETQEMALAEGEWSGGGQLFVRGRKAGDFVELSIPAEKKRTLTLYATKSWDYGILRFTVNGQPAGKDYDAWNGKPIASGPIPLGAFEPKDGALLLRVEVVGANPKSRGSKSYFGLDAVTVTEP